MLDLYLIRHAESDMNNNPHLIGGRSNETPLSERGKIQSLMLGRRLYKSEISFDSVYTSTAKRALATAKPVSDQLGYSIDEIIQCPELLELDQGDWEGTPRIEVYTPEVLQKINSNNWEFTPPNGESQKNVEERMLIWANALIPYSMTVAAFTHGMAVKCLLRGIMQFSPKMTYKITLDNTSITRLKHDDTGWHLISVNDSAHLSEIE